LHLIQNPIVASMIHPATVCILFSCVETSPTEMSHEKEVVILPIQLFWVCYPQNKGASYVIVKILPFLIEYL
jgi:hypothetical protein